LLPLEARHYNTPCPDDIIGVTSKQSRTIGRPSQRDTLWLSALLTDSWELRLELIDLALLLKVEDDDLRGGSSAEPVPVGGEDESVDLVTSIEGVKVL